MTTKKRERSDSTMTMILKKRKRSIRRKRRSIFDVLPIDIINEILLCLSAADVVKIRHVCNKFAQLSRQPSFISEHMKRHNNSDASASLIMYLFKSPNLGVLRALTKLPILGKAKIMIKFNASQLNYYQRRRAFVRVPMILRTRLKYLEAACDGLLCFRKNREHTMWIEYAKSVAELFIGNPLTKEWMSVSIPVQNRHVNVFGFYFHATSGKYKLLLQFLDICEPFRFCYGVFELVPNIVRPINYTITCQPVLHCHGPVLIHGNLHWFGREGQKTMISGSDHDLMVRAIVVFNMEKEQFSQMPIPNGFNASSDFGIFEFKGKLCLVKLDRWPSAAVWILEDYENGIWIEKKAVIKSDLRYPRGIQQQTYEFVLYTSKGGFLLVKPGFYDANFIFYYKELPDVRDFEELCIFDHASMLLGQKYNETLASVGMQQQM